MKYLLNKLNNHQYHKEKRRLFINKKVNKDWINSYNQLDKLIIKFKLIKTINSINKSNNQLNKISKRNKINKIPLFRKC